jgi:hypothetical protein
VTAFGMFGFFARRIASLPVFIGHLHEAALTVVTNLFRERGQCGNRGFVFELIPSWARGAIDR